MATNLKIEYEKNNSYKPHYETDRDAILVINEISGKTPAIRNAEPCLSQTKLLWLFLLNTTFVCTTLTSKAK